MVKLLIYSDLHLDANHFSPILEDGTRVDANADVVVLAGDINEGTRGMRWARECFPDKRILYVAGNHEFYGGHWTRTLDDLREDAHTYNINFLEADGADVGGVRFLGCTMWTDFHLLNIAHREPYTLRAKAVMNDYRMIKISRLPELFFAAGKSGQSLLVPELTALRHKGSVDWLESKLKKGIPEKTVVITHHAPHANSVPLHYQTDPLSAAYASDLTRLMGRSALWIHGHIHDSVDYEVNGTRVVSNPRGYKRKPGGYENAAFNPSFVVEV
jgi:Icc-related predicted phosphoesterase